MTSPVSMTMLKRLTRLSLKPQLAANPSPQKMAVAPGVKTRRSRNGERMAVKRQSKRTGIMMTMALRSFGRMSCATASWKASAESSEAFGILAAVCGGRK